MVYRGSTCLFCGNDDGEPLTREHIWSDWMTDPIISTLPPPPGGQKKEFTIIHRTEDKSGRVKVVQRHSKRMDEKPQCLCHPCNHQKLGDMENKFFKPLVEPMMLHGTSTRLTVENCLTISAWAFKTLVIHNHAYNAPPFLYSAAERKRFIETLFPPEKNFRVWLARFNVQGRTGHMTGLPLGPNARASNQLKKVSHYAFTFSVGQFMFQAHAIRPKRGRRSDFTHMFPAPAYWANKTVEIWPRFDHGDLTWPPPQNLPNSELDQFCCRWGGRLSPHLTDLVP